MADGAAATRGIIEAAEEVRPDDDAEIARLATVPTLEYERQRKEAAVRLGIRAGMLDKLVAVARSEASGSETTNGHGHRLDIADPEPWPDPVDGSTLIEGVTATIRRYVVLNQAAADAAALWALHTHAVAVAYVSPRLAITSPEKRCGKTTLLTVLGALVARPLPAANMTAATMFRAIEAAHPTLLVDEADTFLGQAEELRGVINAGHSRATAIVLRTVETRDGREVRTFAVWGAMALAAIGRLPGTIEDRAIKIALRRRRPDEDTDRLRLDRLVNLAPLARYAARWVTDNLDVLSAADPAVPAELHDRAADNWRPLLAIADAIGGVWPERARLAAVELTADGAEDGETHRIMLLRDIRDLFRERQTDRLASEDVVANLGALDDRPWSDFRGGKPLSKAQLARLLKPFGILPMTIRLADGRTPKGYHLGGFDDAFARYLPQSQRHNATTEDFCGKAAAFKTPHLSVCGIFKAPVEASVSASCGIVADRRLDAGDEAFNERAAILEYDGGYPRAEAERIAGAELHTIPGAVQGRPER